MTTNIYEYVWHDALGNLRSKSKVEILAKYDPKSSEEYILQFPDFLPEWNFDGSSTGQAEGFSSDVVLKPVASFKDPFRQHYTNAKCYLIWCETYHMDGTPHATNNRAKCMEICKKTKNFEPWFGIEQEYILYQLNKELQNPSLPYQWMGMNLPNYKFPEQAHPHVNSSVICNDGYYPLPSGPFYCGVGGDRVFGRNIVEKHLEYCLYTGLKVCGINAEVTASQWEFQVGICTGEEMGDHLWMSRYILCRVAEEFGAYVEFGVKPMQLWNGSGCHTNFSTKEMREENGYVKIAEACEKLSLLHKEHLEEYGDETNKLRLTGKHETASYDKFTYGDSNRGCSIRIPYTTHKEQKGYLEDRRPGSNCDPYKVVTRLLRTICLDEK